MITRLMFLKQSALMLFASISSFEKHYIETDVIRYDNCDYCQLTSRYMFRRMLDTKELDPIFVINAKTLKNGSLLVSHFSDKNGFNAVDTIMTDWIVVEYDIYGVEKFRLTKNDYLIRPSFSNM